MTVSAECEESVAERVERERVQLYAAFDRLDRGEQVKLAQEAAAVARSRQAGHGTQPASMPLSAASLGTWLLPLLHLAVWLPVAGEDWPRPPPALQQVDLEAEFADTLGVVHAPISWEALRAALAAGSEEAMGTLGRTVLQIQDYYRYRDGVS